MVTIAWIRSIHVSAADYILCISVALIKARFVSFVDWIYMVVGKLYVWNLVGLNYTNYVFTLSRDWQETIKDYDKK